MTSNVMESVLKKFGVVKFDPMGQKFDPNMMEAIYTLHDAKLENNTVG